MKQLFSNRTKLLSCIFLAGALASCGNNSTTPETETKDTKDSIVKENKEVSLKPAMPAPEWGPSIKPEMAVVIEKLSQSWWKTN